LAPLTFVHLHKLAEKSIPTSSATAAVRLLRFRRFVQANELQAMLIGARVLEGPREITKK
jgi:AMMECR1 domain-containing protein